MPLTLGRLVWSERANLGPKLEDVPVLTHAFTILLAPRSSRHSTPTSFGRGFFGVVITTLGTLLQGACGFITPEKIQKKENVFHPLLLAYHFSPRIVLTRKFFGRLLTLTLLPLLLPLPRTSSPVSRILLYAANCLPSHALLVLSIPLQLLRSQIIVRASGFSDPIAKPWRQSSLVLWRSYGLFERSFPSLRSLALC